MTADHVGGQGAPHAAALPTPCRLSPTQSVQQKLLQNNAKESEAILFAAVGPRCSMPACQWPTGQGKALGRRSLTIAVSLGAEAATAAVRDRPSG